ncbi:hypothetical protein JTE90_002769 [Oedothorax gibbosus]|uniref:Neurotransmitter-gated ion-channel ligand-binding domain-containing protein n=1 Tax=Oedothorax gibbosus TaxID=931172 RepID=A0AAV6UNQ4_9ARAC|nr:hypothetical protein JTE90_002769 [Oedothorax gibbosus]
MSYGRWPSAETFSDIEYSAEKRLVDKLMRGYDNTVRPVKNASDAVTIRLGITLTQIFDLVSKALCIIG